MKYKKITPILHKNKTKKSNKHPIHHTSKKKKYINENHNNEIQKNTTYSSQKQKNRTIYHKKNIHIPKPPSQNLCIITLT